MLLVCVAGVAVSCCFAGCAPSSPASVGDLPLTFIRDIRLPGEATRLDYQVIDGQSNRLYLAHLGDSAVDVVDLVTDKVETIDNIASAHGLAAAPDQHRIIASASGTNEAVIIDTRTNQVTARVPTGGTPDGIAYDPTTGTAFVSNENDHVETVFNVASHRVTASIDIGGHAGNSIYDPVSRTILVNVQSRNQLITIDPETDRITGRISVEGCDSNHGLFVDGMNRRAFVACEGNATLLVVDLRSGRTTQRFPVGETPDVFAFDNGLHRLYLASESGVVSVFHAGPGPLRKLGESKLADGAHTVAVDQATHRVYFPLANVDGKPALRIMSAKQLNK